MTTLPRIPCRRLRVGLLACLTSVPIIAHAAPETPRGVRSDIYSGTTAELFWQRSSGDPLVVGYELTRDGQVLGVFDALSYVDRTLSRGTAYEYTITAIDAQGARSESTPVIVEVPASRDEQIASLRREVAELRARLAQADGTGEGPPIPILSTGQTISYAFGDDGDFRTGVAMSDDRFADNGDGTFVDTLTGLTWLGIRDCIVEGTWSAALEHANELSAGGDACPELRDGSVAGDWRLPNIRELYSLTDIADDLPALAAGIPLGGSGAFDPSAYYWSSSSFQPVPEVNAFALWAGFGLIESWSKSESGFLAWAVRVER